MNITDMVSEQVQKFIRDNENADVSKLLLSGKSVGNLPISWVVDQIRARKKAKAKLPSWYERSGVVFPPMLSIEQSSSEITGSYKSEIATGKRLIDLTGGMGIDSSFFARKCEEVCYVERHKDLVEIFEHNCEALGIKNIDCVNGDGIAVIENADEDYYDVIYLDPARRGKDNQKVFAIADCEPDVVKLQKLFQQKAHKTLIKLSPMLDISHTLSHLRNVKEVYVIAVDNECKELLFLIERDLDGQPVIKTVNIESSAIQKLDFSQPEEQSADLKIGNIGKFLYEPNVALLKAGAFKLPTSRYGIYKLDEHTHLYSADILVPDFPGKVYEVDQYFQPNKKLIKKHLAHKKVSVKTRNFPESVSAIRKKYNLKDGNDAYVFFCQAEGKYTVVECRKAGEDNY
ncbi:MAG: RsmD family RNA methyltransferase [Bacteroidota bacterium]